MERGRWLDPRGADMALATWAEEFLSLARRLSPLTQEAYRRDLDKYVLPRFGAYRIGRLPADEIENWLNDEVAAGLAPSSVHRHYRTLRRMLQVAVEKERILANPCELVQPPRVPHREMVVLDWPDAVELAEAHGERYRAFIYLAVDSGMRWSELVGLRRARLDVRTRKVRVTEQLVRLQTGEWLRKEPKTASSIRSITISAVTAELLAAHLEAFANPGRRAALPQPGGEPADLLQLVEQQLRPSVAQARPVLPISRPQAYECRPGHRRGSAPQGDPDPNGPFVHPGHSRPLRTPLPRTRRGTRRVVRRPAGRGSGEASSFDGRPRPRTRFDQVTVGIG